ncbi:hypothetical protein MHYP_G00258780 [Metynnis hypsauchen]
MVERLRDLMASSGFELHQWACNDSSVLSHLLQEARSESLDLWLAQDKSNPLESTLGLSWKWEADSSLGYKHRPVRYGATTLRNMYRVLTTQYDPLGYLLPFSTQEKLIIRQLWDKQRGWDDPNLSAELLQAWSTWEDEFRAVHLDILQKMDADAYLMAIRQFVVRRGTPVELWSEQGIVSTDIADIDPITPSSLLMGRPDGLLPQVVYPET